MLKLSKSIFGDTEDGTVDLTQASWNHSLENVADTNQKIPPRSHQCQPGVASQGGLPRGEVAELRPKG